MGKKRVNVKSDIVTSKWLNKLVLAKVPTIELVEYRDPRYFNTYIFDMKSEHMIILKYLNIDKFNQLKVKDYAGRVVVASELDGGYSLTYSDGSKEFEYSFKKEDLYELITKGIMIPQYHVEEFEECN